MRTWIRDEDKAQWGDGAWAGEPDKAQWTDEATGYDCLMVRNYGGALCGYVGVPEGHPAFGKDYDHEVLNDISVHGGLTFASGCHEPTREQWERDGSPGTFEAWVEETMAHRVCHVSETGAEVWWLGFDCAHAGDATPKRDWELSESVRREGFADWNDYMRSKYSDWPGSYRNQDTYRDFPYVQGEVARLATQLKAMETNNQSGGE